MPNKVIEDGSDCERGYGAMNCPETVDFIKEIMEVCKRHQLCIVPTFEGEVSAHDPMQIVPYTREWDRFISRSIVYTDGEECK